MRTLTLTIVLQHVCEDDDHFPPVIATALQEYVDDIRKGDAGNSLYERHITKNRCRLDVIGSVPPILEEIASEGLTGDASTALKERLLKLRLMARGLPGGPDAGEIADFAYAPLERAKDIRELTDELLGAIGVVPEVEPEEEQPAA